MAKIVLSSVGKDRPGIVSAFTKILYEFDCNIEDASMTILCNQFAMILIISAPDNLDFDKIKQNFTSLENSLGLRTNITLIENELDTDKTEIKTLPYMICVSGGDKTGIAFHITEILAKYNVNITDFNSKLIGKKTKPVYIMMIETQIPQDIELEKLKEELNNKANELNLDIKITEIECCEL